MKYKEILRNGKVALLENEANTEYVVAVGYDPDAPENQQWDHGYYFTYWDGNNVSRKGLALLHGVDFFCCKIEEKHISRSRMEEVATAALHELKETDEDSFTDFCEGDLDLTDKEKEWFGLNNGEENEEA